MPCNSIFFTNFAEKKIMFPVITRILVCVLALLWISALLTLYTGYDYLRAGQRHAIDDGDGR